MQLPGLRWAATSWCRVDTPRRICLQARPAAQATGCWSTTVQATFVLAVISDRHPRGQRLVADLGTLPLIRAQLPHVAAIAAGRGPEAQAAGLLAQWLALALGKLVEDAPDVSIVVPFVYAIMSCNPLLSHIHSTQAR